MKSYTNRQAEVIRWVAQQAIKQPRLTSGLWFHNDIRNNYYYASYLLVSAMDEHVDASVDREVALKLGTEIMLRVLKLQNREPEHEQHGHFPLGLHPSPDEAKPNALPAEILGCLMAYFYDRYKEKLPGELMGELELTLDVLYRAPYYRVPQTHYGHHESKYIATKLIFGERYKDEGLLEDGVRELKLTLARLREQGMPEYGALPWFWHWVQAFTCAYECVGDEAIREDLRALLNELWMVRAQHYLGGAWVGARMRSLPHDLPRDRNVLFDYVQFGDFQMPSELPRAEYAGLLFYQAPAEALQIALKRDEPTEMNQVVTPWSADAAPLHKSTYMTKQYAIGGIKERVKEFDNEQHRWDVAFPLTEEGSINHLYMFQPGDGYKEGDPRHQSDNGKVLLHRNTIVALYPPSESGEQRLVGVLPKGDWVQQELGLFGYTHGVYVAMFFMCPFDLNEQSDRIELTSEGLPNGVYVEVMGDEELKLSDVRGLDDFCSLMQGRKPVWSKLMRAID
jgi:hypothetical protein